ncbi:BrnT family toxin [Duganella sp. FT109W]|uniref:BrnT family toxin n=1 Tax=Duganella margarita TaxID=2692170 RepID=A0ABW9WCN1_9BURK|nr:BrnT family toxin [Duganella margarita]MYN38709.1 BrnT family toxin [Duganella margarita]
MHNQFNDVEFDPRKERANLRKHRVSFAQAEQALYDQLAITTEDTRIANEQRFSTLGADASGRVLIVIHTPRGTRTRLISARKASKGEAEQYYAQRL